MKNFYTFLIAFCFVSFGFAQSSDSEGFNTFVTPTAPIQSTVDTSGEAVAIFAFGLSDGTPGIADSDLLPTKVTNIRLKARTGLNTAVWTTTIENIVLESDGSAVTIASTVITDTTIDLNIASGDLDIADGGAVEITIKVYLKNTGIVDTDVISVFIDSNDHGFTADPTGSTFRAAFQSDDFNSDGTIPFSDILGNEFQIIVDWTQLTFLSQISDPLPAPPTTIPGNSLVSPALQVAWTDENGNVDINRTGFLSRITLSTDGTFSSASALTVNPTAGVSTFDSVYLLEEDGTPITIAARRAFGTPQVSIESFPFIVGPSGGTTYIYDGTSWDMGSPDGNSTSVDTILIQAGDITFTDSNNFAANVVIDPGASLTIDTGSKLTVIDNLTLNSISSNYSSFIFKGTRNTSGTAVGGQIRYKRFVNIGTSGSTPGNDLISSPLASVSWSAFLSTQNTATTTNADDLISNGTNTLFAFAPFNKGTGTYANYTNASGGITSGTGYRVSTDNGSTLTFVGDVQTGDVARGVSVAPLGTPYRSWNLIGNPYPSYISITDFLNYDPGSGTTNLSKLISGTGVYGYQGNPALGWSTWTLSNANLIAPGQGFFVTVDGDGGGSTVTNELFFNRDMRRTSSQSADGLGDLDGDDFIAGRSTISEYTFLKLNASSSTKTYKTEFYFNDNSTLGLDHGYDGKMLGNPPSFAIYSHLVQDNNDSPIALQSLNPTDLINTTIALGVNCNQGEQLNFSILESTLPESVNIYLDDVETNSTTLLNSGDYNLTTTGAISGTGRFFLRFEDDSSLSAIENTLNDLTIYINQNLKEIVINGQLLKAATASIYDIQGRLVKKEELVSSQQSQTINVQNLSAGVYVVQLQNGNQSKTQKVILR